MPISILMPALSPTMKQGNLVAWRKQPGDQVNSGDILFDIETDKAIMEVEAVDEGRLGPHLITEGSGNIAVGTLLAHLYGEDEENLAASPAMAPNPATPSPPNSSLTDLTSLTEAPFPSQASLSTALSHQETASVSTLPLAPTHQKPDSGLKHPRQPSSPLARRIAQQNNLNINRVKPSRSDGLIVKRDVLRDIAEGVSTPILDVPHTLVSPLPLSEKQRIPLSSLRQHIAQRLQKAYQEIPHFFLSLDINLGRLMALRAEINAAQELTEKPRISINDFFIKASGLALKACPQINVCWDNDAVLTSQYADIAVAVSIPGGLITPIVFQSELKTLTQISQTMKDLAHKAKNNTLKPLEFQGGSFTISNLGMFGITNFMPIINPPHAAILALGAAQKRPIISGDSVNISPILSATLAVDHRCVDGAEAAQFLGTLKDMIENPLALLI